jgi:glutamate--cysteine ligase
MMKQTATVQVNIDYADEEDAILKMRVGMGLAPILGAMFANSPLCDGGLNRFLSYRGHIWTDTDNNRSGLLRFVFEPGAGFERYVEYALDVPMYFIIRDGRWFNMTEHTFREFLQNGHQGHRATMDDWNSHLTTLFPETRMKRYIEIRSADSQAPEYMLAVPALAKGVLYESDCLLAAWDLVKGWSWEERLDAYHAAHRVALHAKVKGIELRELARELLQIAVAGLHRQRVLNDRGQDESIYLDRLDDLVRRGLCPAEEIVKKWDGEWNQDITRLIEGSSYRVADARYED